MYSIITGGKEVITQHKKFFDYFYKFFMLKEKFGERGISQSLVTFLSYIGSIYYCISLFMEKRKLGNQGLEVSTIGLGCMGVTQSYPPFPQKKDMIKLIHQAIDLGVNFFDTAEGYGPYENEKLLGEAIKGHRKILLLLLNLDLTLQEIMWAKVENSLA